MLLSEPTSQTPLMAASRHMGTIRMIAPGRDQLSYWAESTMKTSTAPKTKTNTAVLPARICCNVSSVHSKLIVAGSSFAARASIVAIACPELTPGAVPPAISADANML